MYEWLVTAQPGSFWGITILIFVILMNLTLAFLAFLTYFLRSKGWYIVAVFFVLSSILHIALPTPSLRKWQENISIPPGDAFRLIVVVLGLCIGLYEVWRSIRAYRQPAPAAPVRQRS